ncbi:uncharacterized protein PGTG_02200 [Puccinia graminis f. sp. tritici CRL 75-36-700-3]|uniref:Plus3 domain-containing protein n=1 Tax=Puccinia graminis f. sp. tritici (strain CRL 75-36-700-3 / race SCCL) TaxID=418459 RepID=E3JXG4_PUCGT|nr:uncharacterized protein PGTG_02200 [Puccinia graminis f. sp. tritici CRL 75-36-700-3]EFP76739.1 hypothetical protein PGTG_02200 [Puccinia graminis f. sp. tritici CRL 75-36-700-3]
MSDLDNELLALAGGDISQTDLNPPNSQSAHQGAAKRTKKSSNNPVKPKKRKTMEMDTESDMEMSSGSDTGFAKEEDKDGPSRVTSSNLYPYEGIYKDAADKQRIQSMSELDREAILGDRQDEIQKIRDRENVKNMVRARDEASGKRYSARDKSRIGVTSEKTQKLDELKQRRQAKEKRPKPNEADSAELNRKRNGLNYESEDGEIDIIEEQAIDRGVRAAKKFEDNATLNDIRSVMLTRSRAAELCSTKFFEEYAKGMWVRVSVGFSKDDPKREVKYRVGEITNIVQHRKYYEVEGQATKVALVVVLAKDEKTVLLDVVSNSSIQENEWLFVVGECQKHAVRLPSKKEISRKIKMIEKYQDWVKDESDITAQVKAKKEMRAQGLGPTTLTISERLRLESERDQAAALGNLELAAQLTRQLEQASGAVFKTDSLMSELNERNRKANREEIRRAEVAASELRRQQMKALEAGAAVKLDPSARVKINPKLTYEARSSTPSQVAKPSASGTPSSSTASSAITNNATKEKTQLSKFEEMVASQVHVDIDIGDF